MLETTPLDCALEEELELAREMVEPEDQYLIDEVVRDATIALRKLRETAEAEAGAHLAVMMQEWLAELQSKRWC